MIGLPRQLEGKAAGLRTHILVTLGACAFVMSTGLFGMSTDGQSRVIQGIVTGIGFIGAGSIIRMRGDIRGLTSAALIWVAAAVGVEIGLGEVGVAALTAIIGVVVLTVVKRFEHRSGS
jgi:putative Mg2+ transporter-C (MgtC) family protein